MILAANDSHHHHHRSQQQTWPNEDYTRHLDQGNDEGIDLNNHAVLADKSIERVKPVQIVFYALDLKQTASQLVQFPVIRWSLPRPLFQHSFLYCQIHYCCG
ncbi:hypothetical protein RO3G_01037 [Rhizopus delemar RA 99-880]|uniref:Uncharacterized protein n=1 Tax=Rhizopus delemar (strain RA 99-880 / ATCC MYA-4621 / FGSC 9543 / NRRL 43880) TaxID=246409 RepID=I1BJF3_RHIO9|nr:hypothetical protein RO3G_01037 [Rhizopus delemar RA 99-880]|eukprot:EIE76333.1 hypothetical protein RO3G_01037 [Rhizopus delemar RA 99-880]